MKWGDRSQAELPLVTSWRDNVERLSVGKPPLYKQGKCMICKIPLFGKEDKDRNVCGAVYCGAQAARRNGTGLP